MGSDHPDTTPPVTLPAVEAYGLLGKGDVISVDPCPDSLEVTAADDDRIVLEPFNGPRGEYVLTCDDVTGVAFSHPLRPPVELAEITLLIRASVPDDAAELMGNPEPERPDIRTDEHTAAEMAVEYIDDVDAAGVTGDEGGEPKPLPIEADRQDIVLGEGTTHRLKPEVDEQLPAGWEFRTDVDDDLDAPFGVAFCERFSPQGSSHSVILRYDEDDDQWVVFTSYYREGTSASIRHRLEADRLPEALRHLHRVVDLLETKRGLWHEHSDLSAESRDALWEAFRAQEESMDWTPEHQ